MFWRQCFLVFLFLFFSNINIEFATETTTPSTAAPKASFALTDTGLESHGLIVHNPQGEVCQPLIDELVLINNEHGLPLYNQSVNRLQDIMVSNQLSGTVRVTLRILLQKPPTKDYYKIAYSTSHLYGEDTYFMLPLLHPPIGEWFDLVFFLPDFFPQRTSYSIRLVNPNDEKRMDKRLHSDNIHVWKEALWLGEEKELIIGNLQIEPIDSPPNNDNALRQLLIKSSQKAYLPLKKNIMTIILLSGGLLAVILCRFSIGLKIFIGLYSIFILTLSFLFIHYPQEQKEFLEGLIQEQKLQLEELQSRIVSEGYKIEEDFASELDSLITEFKSFLKAERQNGRYFRENKDLEIFLALTEETQRELAEKNTSQDSLDRFLFAQFEKFNIDFVLTNSFASWFSRRTKVNLEFRYYNRFFHQILNDEIRNTANDQEKNLGFIGDLFSELRNLLSFGTQNSRLIDDFLNGPGHLSDLNISNLISRSARGRMFWSAFIEEDIDEMWFIIGAVQKEKLISSLKNRVTALVEQENQKRRKSQREPLSFFFSGLSDWQSFPQENIYHLTSQKMAALVHEKKDKIFAHIENESESDIYLAEKFLPLDNYILVLHCPISHVSAKLIERENQFLLLIGSSGLLLLLFSFIFTHHIIKPLRILNIALETLTKKGFGTPIPVYGKDQFSELLNQFNSILNFLDNKKLQFIFLTKALLSSQTMKKPDGNVENILLFCLQIYQPENIPANQEYLVNKKPMPRQTGIISHPLAIQDMQELYCLFSECMDWHQGYTEGIKNNSCFAFFSEDLPAENSVKALYDLRVMLKDKNKKRQEQELPPIQARLAICSEPTIVYLHNEGYGLLQHSFAGANSLAIKMNQFLHYETEREISIVCEEKALSRLVSISNTKYQRLNTELENTEKRLFYEIL